MNLFFEEKLIDEIIKNSIFLLEKFGIFVESEDIEKLLISDGGMKEDGRIKLKGDKVLECVKNLPYSFEIFNRDGEMVSLVGAENVHYVPGSAALDFLCGGNLRPAVTKDFIEFVTITDYLPLYSFQSTAIVCSDVREESADIYRLYICLLYCKKPVVTGVFRTQSLKIMKEILMVFRGDEKELKEKPFAIFDVCPSPPLRWSNLSLKGIEYLSQNSIPVEFVSMPSPGATSPVTLFDAISQHVAESLSGAYISYLFNPETPVIFGGSPAPVDMRYGTFPIASIESAIMNIYACRAFKKISLPTHAYMGLSDSKVVDYQSGAESAIGIILATLTGINVVSGPGMLNFEKAQSIEKLILDHEVCIFAKKLKERIEKREDVISAMENLIEKGSLFSHLHTRRWYKKELTFPLVFSREDEDRWASSGKKDALIRAKEFGEKILLTHSPTKAPDEKKVELDKIIKSLGIREI